MEVDLSASWCYDVDMYRPILYDANMINEELLESDARPVGSRFSSSVSIQEVLGMQKVGRDSGYEYALPKVVHRSIYRPIVPMGAMAGHMAVAPGADRLTLPRVGLGEENIELGHQSLADAHLYRNDDIFERYLKLAIDKKTDKYKAILKKWNLIRREIDEIIPLDDDVIAEYVTLAARFTSGGYDVKTTFRNTRNDLLTMATAHVRGALLVTKDNQLMGFYEDCGFEVEDGGDFIFVDSQPSSSERVSGPPRRLPEAFVNRPAHLRGKIKYGPEFQ